MPRKFIPREKYDALIGKPIGTSEWIEMPQSRIDAFCDVTEDFQFIHNDPERAKSDTPFGGAVAHGFLTLALATKMYKDTVPYLDDHPLIINYGLDRVRFLAPVPSGARIRGSWTLAALQTKREGQVLATNDLAIEIEDHQKPAMMARWLTLLVADK